MIKKFLTREEILGMRDLRTEEVPVPQWGDEVVIISELPAVEMATLHEFITDSEGKTDHLNLYAKMTVRSAVYENGDRIFSDDDYSILNRKHPEAVKLLGITAMRLNALMSTTEKNGDTSASETSTSV